MAIQDFELYRRADGAITSKPEPGTTKLTVKAATPKQAWFLARQQQAL